MIESRHFGIKKTLARRDGAAAHQDHFNDATDGATGPFAAIQRGLHHRHTGPVGQVAGTAMLQIKPLSPVTGCRNSRRRNSRRQGHHTQQTAEQTRLTGLHM